MPSNKEVFRLTTDYVEALHDRGLKLFFGPNSEPVQINDCLNRTLLESSVEQPFQAGYGVEFYPTIYDKAACLFCSIVCGHIFGNGNKRTAVLALDQFLLVNSVYLFLDNDEVEKLTTHTATHNERGEKYSDVLKSISKLLEKNSAPIKSLRLRERKLYRRLHDLKNVIRGVQTISIEEWREGL